MENRTTETTYVEVTNRNNGITGYTLNSGMERIFNINETIIDNSIKGKLESLTKEMIKSQNKHRIGS